MWPVTGHRGHIGAVPHLPKTSLVAKARQVAQHYSSGEDRPLGAYLAGVAICSGLTTGLGLVARSQRRPLPRPAPFEVFLLAAATHKLTRLVSKESITSAIRAPFTEYKGVAGPAELTEEVRGEACGTRSVNSSPARSAWRSGSI
jgi:hypothetical protein